MRRHLQIIFAAFIFCTLLFLFLLTLSSLSRGAVRLTGPVQTIGDTTVPNLSARAVLSIYVDKKGENHLLVAKNPDQPMPLASITKLTTALVADKFYSPELIVTVASSSLSMADNDPGFFRAGDKFSAHALLNPLLIESSNHAAEVLAGITDRNKFIAEMNTLARELGLKNTHFYNPSGLDPSPGEGVNLSTAADVAKLGSYLVLNRGDLLAITRLQGYQLFTAEGYFHHQLINTDQLVNYQGWPAEVVGGKTGTTDFAKRNLLLILRDQATGGYLINVILGSNDNFGEMRKLVDWIYATYKFEK